MISPVCLDWLAVVFASLLLTVLRCAEKYIPAKAGVPFIVIGVVARHVYSHSAIIQRGD